MRNPDIVILDSKSMFEKQGKVADMIRYFRKIFGVLFFVAMAFLVFGMPMLYCCDVLMPLLHKFRILSMLRITPDQYILCWIASIIWLPVITSGILMLSEKFTTE